MGTWSNPSVTGAVTNERFVTVMPEPTMFSLGFEDPLSFIIQIDVYVIGLLIISYNKTIVSGHKITIDPPRLSTGAILNLWRLDFSSICFTKIDTPRLPFFVVDCGTTYTPRNSSGAWFVFDLLH